jgi:hypothetical protein
MTLKRRMEVSYSNSAFLKNRPTTATGNVVLEPSCGRGAWLHAIAPDITVIAKKAPPFRAGS